MNKNSEALIAVIGNAYPVKEKLKALGAKWAPLAKVWMVPKSKFEEAMKLVDSAPETAKFAKKSGGPSKRCWECGCNFTHYQCKERDGDWSDSYCGC